MLIPKPSQLISSQLPEYINEQYPLFVKFIETYWQFLEQEGHTVDVLINQAAYDDIDRTLEAYIPFFKAQYAESFPDIAVMDRRLLIKHIKDFYLAKGSEDAFKIFFQIVYGIRIEMSYPSSQMMRASDGEYSHKVVIRVSKLVGDPLSLSGNNIGFADAGGNILKKVFCEDVQIFTIAGNLVYEITLKTQDIEYAIDTINSSVKIYSDDLTISATLYTMIVDSVIVESGTDFAVGDIGTIYGTGSGAKISVGRVDINTGAITKVNIDDFGINYAGGDVLTMFWDVDNLVWVPNNNLVSSVNLSGLFYKAGSQYARVDLILGKVGVYPRKFTGTSGWASGDSKIQDNYYHQLHSYVINSEISRDIWINGVHDNAHIAGSRAFSAVALSTDHIMTGGGGGGELSNLSKPLITIFGDAGLTEFPSISKASDIDGFDLNLPNEHLAVYVAGIFKVNTDLTDYMNIPNNKIMCGVVGWGDLNGFSYRVVVNGTVRGTGTLNAACVALSVNSLFDIYITIADMGNYTSAIRFLRVYASAKNETTSTTEIDNNDYESENGGAISDINVAQFNSTDVKAGWYVHHLTGLPVGTAFDSLTSTTQIEATPFYMFVDPTDTPILPNQPYPWHVFGDNPSIFDRSGEDTPKIQLNVNLGGYSDSWRAGAELSSSIRPVYTMGYIGGDQILGDGEMQFRMLGDGVGVMGGFIDNSWAYQFPVNSDAGNDIYTANDQVYRRGVTMSGMRSYPGICTSSVAHGRSFIQTVNYSEPILFEQWYSRNDIVIAPMLE